MRKQVILLRLTATKSTPSMSSNSRSFHIYKQSICFFGFMPCLMLYVTELYIPSKCRGWVISTLNSYLAGPGSDSLCESRSFSLNLPLVPPKIPSLPLESVSPSIFLPVHYPRSFCHFMLYNLRPCSWKRFICNIKEIRREEMTSEAVFKYWD